MLAEISVVPQVPGSGREVVANAVAEIAAQGLRYEVGAAGTAVEGELDRILAAVRAIEGRLGRDGVTRALIDLRILMEPHAETLEHQVEGLGSAARR